MKKQDTMQNFGKRLASIRRDRGLSQDELARQIGTSRRMLVYYEAQSSHVPAHLLVPLSKALNVSLEELLGVRDLKLHLDQKNKSLWKKLKRVDLLPKKDQKILLHILDTLVQNATSEEPNPFKVPSLHEAAKRKIAAG